MDPFSDILSLLQPRSLSAAALDLGAPWSVRFARQQNTIKCNALVSGAAWVSVAGEQMRMTEGDFFLLPTGRDFVFSSQPGVPSVPAERVVGEADAPVAVVNGGGDTIVVSCRFSLGNEHAARLIAGLPPILRVAGDLPEARHLRRFGEAIVEELRLSRPGAELAAQHLSHLMLIQTLRLYQAGGGRALGWLSAISDPKIGPAVMAMHKEPARVWTLAELAAIAGMSRSVFARRFRAAAGVTPMVYLVTWRMLQAAQRLRSSRDPVAVVAAEAGYASEAAFGAAFKRTMGASPRAYVRSLREPPTLG